MRVCSFWDDAMKKLDDKTKSEHIATLLCQHDYADIEPECKLFILEKICTAISDLYKSKLAIAKEMGLVRVTTSPVDSV